MDPEQWKNDIHYLQIISKNLLNDPLRLQYNSIDGKLRRLQFPLLGHSAVVKNLFSPPMD